MAAAAPSNTTHAVNMNQSEWISQEMTVSVLILSVSPRMQPQF
jgi:hypothetical protein